MTTHTDLPDRWCRMWNDDEHLAHDLMTEDARMTGANTPGLDRIVGPAESAAFVADYRARTGITFTVRTVVADDQAVAYTWDAAFPDGTVVTGADVNLLVEGRVSRNWTVSSARRSELEAPDDAGEPATYDEILALCDTWSRTWNGDPSLAHYLLTDDARAWCGVRDGAAVEPVGAIALAAYVEARPRTSYRPGPPVVDATSQRVAFTWTGSGVSGIDVLALHDGRIDRVWSLTGLRAFAF